VLCFGLRPQRARYPREHAGPRSGGLQREQADERGKNDQDLEYAHFVPHLYTSLFWFRNRFRRCVLRQVKRLADGGVTGNTYDCGVVLEDHPIEVVLLATDLEASRDFYRDLVSRFAQNASIAGT